MNDKDIERLKNASLYGVYMTNDEMKASLHNTEGFLKKTWVITLLSIVIIIVVGVAIFAGE
jgi:cytochrome b subunit of formate dehydrogenase